ncbi:MAG: hypothetical protein P1U63_06820 [Coxiellaceae bacterium]|nr:hypothetical protein [Coxiellaceae bacterium]
MNKDFFPQGVASGHAFLGREQESEVLQSNIRLGHHTLLIAPRRFGKTSLARHVLKQMELPYEELNFFLSRSAIAVERKIRKCIQKMLGKNQTQLEKLITHLKAFFTQSDKHWTFGFKGLAEIELIPDREDDVAENIFTAFALLDSVLGSLGESVVLFLDEVQEIDLLKEGKQIQGAIREFAQQAKHVTFIFSGSNRRLLQHMFDDDSMPLYELCERIKLEKIEASIYKKYINHAAKQSFEQALDTDVLDEVIKLSECHPKRTYNLCHQLWLSKRQGQFTVKDVQEGWQHLVEVRLPDVRMKLSQLNTSQLKVMTVIAIGVKGPISGRENQTRLDLSSASITAALKILEDEALLLRENNHYEIIDPLTKWVLATYESENIV